MNIAVCRFRISALLIFSLGSALSVSIASADQALPICHMTIHNSQLPRLMTVLNAGRFARSGVGHCPETAHNWECGHVPELPKGYGRNYRRMWNQGS